MEEALYIQSRAPDSEAGEDIQHILRAPTQLTLYELSPVQSSPRLFSPCRCLSLPQKRCCSSTTLPYRACCVHTRAEETATEPFSSYHRSWTLPSGRERNAKKKRPWEPQTCFIINTSENYHRNSFKNISIPLFLFALGSYDSLF